MFQATLHNHHLQRYLLAMSLCIPPNPSLCPNTTLKAQPMPKMCNSLRRLSICSTTGNLLKALATDCQRVEWIDPHHFHVGRVASEVESDNDHEIGEDQDTALEVIALRLKRQYDFRNECFVKSSPFLRRTCSSGERRRG